MKKILFSLFAVAVTAFSFAQTKVSDVAQFTTETIDLGKMKVNKPATAVFVVKNIGKTPLIIESASPTCGCTVEDFTKGPIAPGKTGEVKATFNAANIGPVHKSMNVKFAGVDEIKPINFTGEVLSVEDFAKLSPSAKPASVKTVKKAAPVKKSR
ncbi:MAG: DUF1573 domain-containing protein [Rhizobacter sp.]|nr:DUF1573 domain-containing protein [Ferruginibacter sp.]